MTRFLRVMTLLGLAAGAALPQRSPELEEPFPVLSGDQAIDVEIGHAAPWFGDFDGDGLPDLLVGQFGEGKLRIYRNVGEAKRPRFDGFRDFEAGGAAGKVPAG